MWNRIDTSWQDPWKSDQQGNSRGGWFEHPSDAECQPQFDHYGAWQPGLDNGNLYGNHSQMPSVPGLGGYGAQDHSGMENHHHHQQQQQQHHHHGMQGQMGHGVSGMASGVHHSNGYGDHRSQPQNNGGGIRLANGQIFGATNANGAATPQPFGSAAARRPTGSPNRGSDDDAAMMADLEESMRNMLPRDDGSDDEDANKRPTEATQEERDEAEQIVRLAFKEAKERDRLRKEVKKCSQADLQAMLNARLARK